MVTVPYFCPDTPALRKNPVFLYFIDDFKKPIPFQADVAVSTDDVLEKKIDAVAAMDSQFCEWIPWLEGYLDKVPAGKAERPGVSRRALRRAGSASWADAGRAKLVERYGEEKGRAVKTAEAFEICEYGSRPDAAELKRLFPFSSPPAGAFAARGIPGPIGVNWYTPRRMTSLAGRVDEGIGARRDSAWRACR